MREQFISELIKEVRGPRNGNEEILSSNPFTEYITGVIIPKGAKSREHVPDSELTRPESDEDFREDGESEIDSTFSVPSELDAQMKPKSFGVSFLVEGEAPILSLCVSWARYRPDIDARENCKEKENPQDRSESWKRFAHVSIRDHGVGKAKNRDYVNYKGPDGSVLINIREVPLTDCIRHIVVSLINDLTVSDWSAEARAQVSLFQPAIRINVKGDGKVIAQPPTSQSELDYLYMDQPVLARGHMCSAVWRSVDYSHHVDPELIWPECNYSDDTRAFIQCDVRSEFIPLHPSPAPDFEWRASDSEGKPELSAFVLSEMWDEEGVDRCLTPIASAYRDWIGENETALKKGQYPDNQFSSEIIRHQKDGLERLLSGIECLRSDGDARLAFCFANRVLWLQDLWKKRKSIGESDTDPKNGFKWRPFQLAFFLTCLESLHNQNSAHRDILDLLWVPTGGGKTEAYLAIMAFAIALRRRKSAAGNIDPAFNESGAGVSIITRYTLRLLTVQQFRRTLLMIIAAEYLRVLPFEDRHGWRPEGCTIGADWLWGETRFSIGMWVGGAVSPNHIRGEYGAVKALQDPLFSGGDPAQIIKCPVCGEWLSIPNAGLPPGENTLHLIVRSDTDGSLGGALAGMVYSGIITGIRLVDSDLPSPYHRIEIRTDSTEKLQAREFDEEIRKIGASTGFTTASFRPSRSGYFPISPEPGRKAEDKYSGFEIFCPNPRCDLNHISEWKEGVPCSSQTEGTGVRDLHMQDLPEAFSQRTAMPIPAYTVDEQIYHRCPTVIISTADKIARLAFEPRAGSMFGDVKRYNRYYGYIRGTEGEQAYLPHGEGRSLPKAAFHPGSTVDVKPFLPPDLILQDELHLMDGPLGSMFGLYEMVVDGLIKRAGGRPKYVASSATVKRAEDQVHQIFNRGTFQFPPSGLSFRDSFFTRFPSHESAWNENGAGKVYMGVYAPGMGPLTPVIRLWSRILKVGQDHEKEQFINNYWTLVGYFNSLRELGGAGSLYHEDIVERLSFISGDNTRPLDPERAVELSSRINSTDIPQLLEDLEQGKNRPHRDNPDAILTTSMFGTGVDIPHLSLMVVNGQPKTTSQYIQATGRVGREHGALVTVFYKAGRPRDLSHYELFTGYHNRVNLSVESASVSPLSQGCLQRGAGPAMVAFLRNMKDPAQSWAPNDGHLVRTENASKDFQTFLDTCFGQQNGTADVREFMQSQFDLWRSESRKLGYTSLRFVESTEYQKAGANVVLGDPAHESMGNLRTVFKNAPQSLREIEETTAFEV